MLYEECDQITQVSYLKKAKGGRTMSGTEDRAKKISQMGREPNTD